MPRSIFISFPSCCSLVACAAEGRNGEDGAPPCTRLPQSKLKSSGCSTDCGPTAVGIVCRPILGSTRSNCRSAATYESLLSPQLSAPGNSYATLACLQGEITAVSIDEENPLDLSERVQGGEADEEDGADPAAPEEVENPVGDDAARPLPDVPLTDADQEQGDSAFEQELTVRAIACLRLLIARAARPLPTKGVFS